MKLNKRQQAKRIETALRDARALLRRAGTRGGQQLAQATLLQGILSGDVLAASMHERQRMQRENLRLRQRFAHVRLRTEQAKAKLLELAAVQPTKLIGDALMEHIADIYGLEWKARPQLPAAQVEAQVVPIVPPVSPENRADQPVIEKKEPDSLPPPLQNMENE